MSRPADLDEATLCRLCRGRRIVRESVWLPRVDSTQDEARRLAYAGGPGALVVAGEQRLGRGRRGRTWWSPPERGLYFSLVIAPQRPRTEWAFLTSLAGLALRDALREAAAVECGIKWPNDLLVRGRKIAGILAEAASEPWVILGVGVNLSQDESEFPDEVQGSATSVGIERVSDPSAPAGAVRIGAAAVLDAFLRALERWLERFETAGPADCLAELRRASVLIGRVVTMEPAGGRPFLRGRVIDFGPGGELILEPPAGGKARDWMTVVGGTVIAIDPPLRDAGSAD